MSRKAWVITIVLVLLLVSFVALAVTGWLLYPIVKAHRAKGFADAAYASGDWKMARGYYGRYLMRYRDDRETLEKYVDACQRVTSDRTVSLGLAVAGMYRLYVEHGKDPQLRQDILDFCLDHGLWQELEYRAELFMEQDKKEQGAQQAQDPAQDGQGQSQAAPDKMLLYYRGLAQGQLGRPEDARETYAQIKEEDWLAVPAAIYGHDAEMAVALGQEDEARSKLDAVVAAHPDRPEMLVQRARFRLAAGELAGADADVRAAFEQGVSDYESLMVGVEAASRRSEWERCAALLEQAIAANPRGAEAYHQLAQLSRPLHRISEAVEMLRALPPEFLADHSELLIGLAELQLTLGQLEAAEKTREQLKRTNPRTVPYVMYLKARELLVQHDRGADAETRREKAEEAAAILLEVTQTSPSFGLAVVYRAKALIRADRREEAKTVLESWLRNHRNDVFANSVWTGEIEGARATAVSVEAAREVLDSPDSPPKSMLQTAFALLAQIPSGPLPASHEALVEGLLERVLKGSPDLVDAYGLYVELLVRQDRVDDAAAQLIRAEQAGVDPVDLSRARAVVHLARGETDEALAVLAGWLEDDTLLPEEDAVAQSQLLRWSELFQVYGGVEAGMMALERLLAAASNDEARWKLEARRVSLCLAGGDLAGAREWLAKLSQAGPDSDARLDALDDARLAVAAALLREGAPEENAAADAMIAEVLARDPGESGALMLRAQWFMRQTPPAPDSARELALRVLEGDPRNLAANGLLSDIAERRGDPASAAKYARVLAEDQPTFQNQLRLADLLLQADDLATGRQILKGVLASMPGNVRALELMIRAGVASGDTEGARADIDALEALPEGTVPAELVKELRALVEVTSGSGENALPLLRELYEKDPESLSAANVYATTLAARDAAGWREAEKLLAAFAERHSDNPKAWVALGNLRKNQGLAEGNTEVLLTALPAYTRALLLVEDYPPALKGMIEIHNGTLVRGAALGLCERYLRMYPDDADVRYQYALALEIDGRDYERALEEVEKAVAPDEAPSQDLLFLRGRLKLNLGDNAGAVADLVAARAETTAPSAALNAWLALAYARAGNYAMAVQYGDAARSQTGSGNPLVKQVLDEADKLVKGGQPSEQ